MVYMIGLSRKELRQRLIDRIKSERFFSWEDQIQLPDCLLEAARRRVKVLLTNASHPSIRDLFESDFSITSVSRRSIIAGMNSSRKLSEELIIRSYK